MKIRLVANVFEEQYDKVYSSADERYKIVSKNGLWGVINNKGEEIIPLIYNDLGDFQDDFITARDKNGWGVIKNNNEVALPLENKIIKTLKDKEGVLFIGGKKEEIIIFSPSLQTLLKVPTEHSVGILSQPISHQKFLNSELILLGLQSHTPYDTPGNLPLYLIKKDSNLKVLKINAAAYSKLVNSLPEKNLKEDPPTETNFKIERVLGNFINVLFKSSVVKSSSYSGDVGALCKLENDELVPFILFGAFLPNNARPETKDDLKKNLKNIIKDNYHSISNNLQSDYPDFVTIANQSYILVKQHTKNGLQSSKLGLYNLDGSIFIPGEYSELWISKYYSDDIIGLKENEIVYIDPKTGKETKKIEKTDFLETSIYETPLSEVYIQLDSDAAKQMDDWVERQGSYSRSPDFESIKNDFLTSRIKKFYLCDTNKKKIIETAFTCARLISTQSEEPDLIAAYSEGKILIINQMGRILHTIDADGLAFSNEEGRTVFNGMGRNNRLNTEDLSYRRGWVTVDSNEVGWIGKGQTSWSSPPIKLGNQVIIIWKGLKLGMLDSNFKTLLPTVYDDLLYRYTEGKDYVVVRKYDATHQIPAEKIKEILETSDPNLEVNEIQKERLRDPNNNFRTRGNYGVVTTQNEPVLPFVFEKIEFLNHVGRGTLFKATLNANQITTELPINKNNIYRLGQKMYNQILETPRDFFIGTFMGRKPISFYGPPGASFPSFIIEEANTSKNPGLLSDVYQKWLTEAQQSLDKVTKKAKEERNLNKKIKEVKPSDGLESVTKDLTDATQEPDQTKENVIEFRVTQIATGLTAIIKGTGADYLECLQDVQTQVLSRYPESSREDYLFERA